MTSKKHFNKMANCINEEVGEWSKLPDVRHSLWSIASCAAEIFSEDNKDFDRIKFMRACGLE
jgi:ferritin-like protein